MHLQVPSSYWGTMTARLGLLGTVHVLEGEALTAQKRKDEQTKMMKSAKAERLSDIQGVAAAASAIATLHGPGGQPKKARRLARQLGASVDRSSRCAAWGLRELDDEAQKDESEEEA